MLVFRVCGVRQNLYVYSLYRNPDLDDRIFGCLLASMAAVQAENETYSEAKRQFSDRNRNVLINVQSPHKWWSTLKYAGFGSSSSLIPLVSEGGGLVCESVDKTDLLSDRFDSKQSS